MSRRDLRIIVVGAGIGGLVTALSLREIGARVDVYESVREVRPLGVGINLLPHAVRELDALLLLESVRHRSIEPESLVYCSRHGQEIWREPRGIAMRGRSCRSIVVRSRKCCSTRSSNGWEPSISTSVTAFYGWMPTRSVGARCSAHHTAMTMWSCPKTR